MQSQTEIRANITENIVNALRNGIVPWRKPWVGPNSPSFPTNFTSQRSYRGMNVLLLRLAEMSQNYPTSYWATFAQWRSVDCFVRAGEKATQIVFWKPVTKTKRDDQGDEESKTFPVLRSWAVFNIAQVEGKIADTFKAIPQPITEVVSDERHEEFEKVVVGTKADIRYGGDKAFYVRPPQDHIVLPQREKFIDFPAFAETLAHELCHWTEWRLGWTGNYAEGELRAEIGACFLSTALGIPNSSDLSNHAAYIHSWLQALENDPKFIFRAATAASKAADHILGLSQPQEATEPEEVTA